MVDEIFISEGASEVKPGDDITILPSNVTYLPENFEDEVKKLIFRKEELQYPEGEVIILGMGSTRKQCPFDAETWAVNMGYAQIMELEGHCEKIFIGHGQVKGHDGKNLFDWKHFNLLSDAGIEVWCTHKAKGLNSKLFPLSRIIRKYQTEFFTDTISYMLVWAIEKGYKKIRMYGCDMMTQEEYAWEKGGIEYWIGFARAKGIEVWIVEGSTLCKTITGKPYGVKYWRMKDIDPFGLLRKKGTLSKDPPKPTPWIKM